MQIFMNDAAVACAEGTTVAELLAQEGIAPVNVAVAVEDTVVPKAQWDGAHGRGTGDCYQGGAGGMKRK